MNKNIIIFSLLFISIAGFAGALTGSNSPLQISTITEDGDITVETTNGFTGKAFVLDGSQSQDDGTIKSFSWRQVSGPRVVLVTSGSASQEKPIFTPGVAGTYVFELQATDSSGKVSVVQQSVFNIEKKSSDSGSAVIKTELEDSDESDDTSENVITGDPDFDLINIGDPDFDLFNINVDSEDINKFRVEVFAVDAMGNVAIDGWDDKKKEEIISNAKNVKSKEEFGELVKAIILNDEAIEGIKVSNDTVELRSSEQGKLFGFIAVKMPSVITIKYDLKDSSADPAIVSVKFPWWHIFVKKYNNQPSAVQLEIVAALNATEWLKVDNSDSVTELSRVSQTLGVVSTVLKTKHDTVKNSISNIR